MEEALFEACLALKSDEVPVGCIIVKDNVIISRAHNTTQKNHDITCHAEINAIKQACKTLGAKTLEDCEMYVTLEPCAMCAGAIINSRIKRLFIGTSEPKSGCCGSVFNLFNSNLNHNTEVYFGFNEDECKKMLKDFFKIKRNNYI